MSEEHKTTTISNSAETIYDAITELDDALVEKAESFTFTQNGFLKKSTFHKHKVFWIATAASICIFIGTMMHVSLGTSDGGSGLDTNCDYQNYMGPVFPLTTTSDTNGIEISRHTNWDFSPYENRTVTLELHPDNPENTETITLEHSETKSIVTDSYVLTNTTSEDITLSLLYPFAGRFSDAISAVPQITIDGEPIHTTLLTGKYSGSYAPVYGDTVSETSGEKINVAEISNWKGYKTLLSDGSYLKDTMTAFPDLDIPVIVYQYSNLTYTGTEAVLNPTMAIHFQHDSSKTSILGWGWTSGGFDGEGAGLYSSSRVYVPEKSYFDNGGTVYLLVLGEDIEMPVIQGYKNTDCEENNKLNTIEADFSKYETTLADFICNVCFQDEMYLSNFSSNPCIQDLLSQEMQLDSIARLMYDDGVLSEHKIERYDNGWLEDYLYDYRDMSRIMYVTFDLTIPAGNRVSVGASMEKNSSQDYSGNTTPHRNGYDMVTTLGSPFVFTKQTASISNYDCIELIDGNFGFDLDAGIIDAALDLQEEHYWMDVRKKDKE